MNIDASPFVEDAVREACGGSTKFAHPQGTATFAVRRHYNRARAVGLPYLDEARRLQWRFERARDMAIEVGAVPNLANAASIFPEERAFSGSHDVADLAADHATVPGEVYRSSVPEFDRLAPAPAQKVAVGDFLITHPLSCLMEQVFDRAVLVLDDCEETMGGVTGIVLNKPMGASLGEMLDRWQCAEDRQWADSCKLGALLNSRLFRGGPILVSNSLKESLRWIHQYGDGLSGARQVTRGVWLGGDLGEVAARARGDLVGVRFILGFAGWSPLQLSIELECGVWVHARAKRSSFHAALAAREICFGPAEREAAWRAAMSSAGMPMFASFPRTSSIDKRLHGYMERLHCEEDEELAMRRQRQLLEEDRARPPSKGGGRSRACRRASSGGRRGG